MLSAVRLELYSCTAGQPRLKVAWAEHKNTTVLLSSKRLGSMCAVTIDFVATGKPGVWCCAGLVRLGQLALCGKLDAAVQASLYQP
jgi:hypothetical protein